MCFTVSPIIDLTNIEVEPKVVVNRSIVLNCPAGGVPTPEVKWLRNDEPLSILRYSALQLLANGRQLRVNGAQMSDGAIYR